MQTIWKGLKGFSKHSKYSDETNAEIVALAGTFISMEKFIELHIKHCTHTRKTKRKSGHIRIRKNPHLKKQCARRLWRGLVGSGIILERPKK